MYACTAAVECGGRCRRAAVDGDKDNFCSAHAKMRDAGKEVEKVGLPDKVLLKGNINPNWTERFVQLGIRVAKPDFAKREAEHIAHAEAHGRQAYAVRKDIADSGVSVFGPEGVTAGVSVEKLINELSADNMYITDMHIHEKNDKRDSRKIMCVLVVTFARSGEKIVANEVALNFFRSSKWGHAHVWANPPKDDGTVLHTVNLAHREDAQAEHKLCYADGLWAVVESR